MSYTAFIGIVTLIVFSAWAYIQWLQKYWARRNIPYLETTSIFGNVGNPVFQKENIGIHIKRSYDELKRRGHKHGGIRMFTIPFYIPVSIDLIKHIMTKDFQHFTDRGFFQFDEKRDPLTAHIFSLPGEKWRRIRVMLTPTFTSGKMKMMFQTLLDCGVPMLDHLDQVSKSRESIEIKDILACYTTDIIGSCAFGLECNSFIDPESDFRKSGRRILTPTLRDMAIRAVSMFAPALQKILPLKQIPADVETFFMSITKNVLDYRRENGIKRNDFVHLFMELQDKAKADNVEGIMLEEIAAQSFLFFIAGFETSSTTMTFCLHELAFNQDIQDKLREEVREALKKDNGVLTYDTIMGMKYMDHVINETLRKYPPVPFLDRKCSLDYKVPDSDVTIEKGTKLFISVLGIHRDEEFYPNPDKFDPARFTEENKAKRPAFSFLPFGDGPRNCIGLRFGYMQTKTGLSMLLNNFRFRPGKGEKYEMDFEPFSFVLTKKGNIMLNIEKLSDRI